MKTDLHLNISVVILNEYGLIKRQRQAIKKANYVLLVRYISKT